MKKDAQHLAAALRDTEARRQETHTRYLEDRGGHNGVSA
jgi:hypothetical protein